MSEHWTLSMERFFRQTGRTTRRLVGAMAFAAQGRTVVFLCPTVSVTRHAQALAGRIDRDLARLLHFRVDNTYALRGVSRDALVVHDHTCELP